MSEPGGPKAPTIPSEDQIHALVHAFYAKIRSDVELGPIFNATIADWNPHLEKMCAFWSSVMRMSGRYHGNPMAAHLRLTGVAPAQFDHWLSLFSATAHELFLPGLASAFTGRAQTIAHSLELGMFFKDRGHRTPLGEPA